MNYYIDVLKKYAVFNGRASRAEYWYFFLFNFIISIILSLVGAFIISNTSAISLAYGLLMLIPSLAVAVRRLHDIGKSGWWLLMGIIPFVGVIILIVYLVKDSQPGDNQYGPSPKSPEVTRTGSNVV